MWHLLFTSLIPGGGCSELGTELLLGRGFSLFSHILAPLWIFNNRLWGMMVGAEWACVQWSLKGGLAVGSALPWAALGTAGTASLLQLVGCWQELAWWPRGAVCHCMLGDAGLAPGGLQLYRGLQCQCYKCFCTQMVWKALFIVLLLFKNVHNSDVIYKADCLQDIFYILRCVYCKKKKDEKWCFSVTVSSDCLSVSLSTDCCSSGVSPTIPVILSKALGSKWIPVQSWKEGFVP